MHSLISFIKERFPPWISIPLILVVTGVNLPIADWPRNGFLFLWAWLLVAIMRGCDDLIDLAKDSLLRPHRGLVTGDIAPPLLRRALMVASGVLALATVAIQPRLFILLIAIALYVIAFYKRRNLLPRKITPFFHNIIFLVLPLLPYVTTGIRLAPGGIALAVFIWLGVVGHDFAHSIELTESQREERLTSLGLSATAQVQLAIAAYACSFFAAMLAVLFTRDGSFLVATLFTTGWLFSLLRNLRHTPDGRNSGQLYVPGFLYFLVPSLVHIAHF